MSYTTGTIINQPLVAETLITAIKNQLTAHAAWSWVENYNDTGGQNWTHDIFKSSGFSNSLGSDWYFVISRPRLNNPTAIYFWVCETYNATTHQAARWTPPNPTNINTLYPVAADTSYSVGTLIPNYFTNNSAHYVSLSTSVTDYWIIATANTVTVATRQAPGGTTAMHAGLFDSLVYQAATNDPVPLQIWGTNNSYNGATAMTTRHPLRGGLQTYGAFGMYWAGWTIGTGAPVKVPQGDLWQNNTALAGRWAIYSFGSQGGLTQAQNAGYLRGLVKPEILLCNPDTAVSAGDTVQIGLHTYVNLYGSIWADTQAN